MTIPFNEHARRLQALLVRRGYNLGTTGPERNGVDGQAGDLTFQAAIAELSKTGTLAPVIAAAAPPVGLLDKISAKLLRLACQDVSEAHLATWVDPIRKACAAHEINTIRRISAFIAQMAHESQCFTRMEENLNYSAQRMAQVWPGRFSDAQGKPNALALSLNRDPQKLANHVYANRLGNGPPESGDGWRFRGGGPLQLTGRSNWQRFANAIGMTLDEAVVYGRTAEGGVMAAAWFWEENDINRLADTPGVADESKRINGGTIGLADRTNKFNALVEGFLRLEKGGAL